MCSIKSPTSRASTAASIEAMTARTCCSGEAGSEQAVNSASATHEMGERKRATRSIISWTSCLTVPEGHGQIPAARLSYKTTYFLVESGPFISRFVAGENREHESHRPAHRDPGCAAAVLFGGRRRGRSAGAEEGPGRIGNPGLGRSRRLAGRQRPGALRQGDGCARGGRTAGLRRAVAVALRPAISDRFDPHDGA